MSSLPRRPKREPSMMPLTSWFLFEATPVVCTQPASTMPYTVTDGVVVVCATAAEQARAIALAANADFFMVVSKARSSNLASSPNPARAGRPLLSGANACFPLAHDEARQEKS